MKNAVGLIASLFTVLVVLGFGPAIFILIRRFKVRYKGLFIGIFTNVCELLISLPLLLIPRGTAIRPMHLPIMFLLIGIVTLIVGLPISFREAKNRESGLQGIIGIALCLLPIFTGVLGLHLVAFIGGLRLAE